MPATQSSVTRHNVHAVFYTCAEVDPMEVQETVTPEVEFHADEYNDSFFPMRADTMKSMDTQMDGNMGDIVQKLDSLDDFFEETEPINSGLDVMPDASLRGFTGAYADTSAHLYDQQTAPILRKSLARTASTSSFHNGLAESRPPNQRFDSVGVYSPNTLMPQVSGHTLRPTTHARSITSPANNLYPPSSSNVQFSTPPLGFSESAYLSDDEFEDGLYEFDERLTNNKPPTVFHNSQGRSVTDGSSSLESMIRSGMRRLTGGAAANREKERQRDLIRAQHRAAVQTANSPRVPKVPPEFLTGPTSNPTSPGQ